MRRWIILLAVMAMAALALYVPAWQGLSPQTVAYPETLIQPRFEAGQWIEPIRDPAWAERAEAGMISYGVLTVCWLVALYWLGRSGGRLDKRTLLVVLIGGGIVGIAMWGLPPTFSLDCYRYRWDALAVNHGYNPYELTPDSMGPLASDNRQLFEATDFRWRPTIYPPFALFCFGVNGAFGNSMIGWRAMLLAAQALLLYACWGIIRHRGGEPGWLAAIALCPLLIVETHLDGHVELIAVALMAAAIMTLMRRQWWVAAVLLALAVNVKYLWPALAGFLLLGQLARQRRLLAGSAVFVVTVVVCWLPFAMMDWSDAATFAGDWGGWLPAPVRMLLAAPREFLEKFNYNATIYRALVGRFHPSSQVPKLIVLGAVVGLAALLIWRRRWMLDIEDISLLIGAALLLSPVSYPWYFLWLLPGLAVLGPGELWPKAGPAVWIVLYLAMTPALHEFVADWVRTGRARPFLPLPWLIVGAVVPLLLAAWTRRATAGGA